MEITLSLFCGLLLVLVSSNVADAQPLTSDYYQESCYWGTCDARLSYYAEGEPTLQGIADLFGVGFNDLMGANNLDITKANTLATSRVTNGTVVIIPTICECHDQVRRTNHTVYTVKKDDTLSYIADTIFGRLTTYPEIAKVNNIQDVNLILEGQALVIPFLCSCPNITAPNPYTIGLTYAVAKGDDFKVIAGKFGSNATTIQVLNNITNASSLLVSQLIRVPLPACKANFSSGAQDGSLIATVGAYNLTAPPGCVQCYCYGTPTPVLHCVPNPARNATLCPSLDCSTNLQIGNLTTKVLSDGQCEVTSCEYGGYLYQGRVGKPITQSVEPTCPAYPTVPAPNELGTIPGASPSTTPGTTLGPPGSPASNNSAIALGAHHQPLVLAAASVLVSTLFFR